MTCYIKKTLSNQYTANLGTVGRDFWHLVSNSQRYLKSTGSGVSYSADSIFNLKIKLGEDFWLRSIIYS
jgi:hypothetical protein